MVDVDPERFERLVADAIDSLAEELASRIDKVVIVVEAWPSTDQLAGRRGTLLGLYEGVNLTRRSPLSYHGVVPDKITIFPWPSRDFEASPYSPAGQLQGLSRLGDGILRSPRRTRWARRIAVGVALVVLAALVVSAVSG